MRGRSRHVGPCRLIERCLAARLLLGHFDRPGDAAHPAPLAALSERERAVCLGILGGQKAEAIAGSLAVSPATAVTYHRRAYQKLGIGSGGAAGGTAEPAPLLRPGHVYIRRIYAPIS